MTIIKNVMPDPAKALEREQAAIQQERDQILATARSVAAVLGIPVPFDAEQRAETEALKRRPR